MPIIAFIPKNFLSVTELNVLRLISAVQQEASILLKFMLYDLTRFPIRYRRFELGQNKGLISLGILLHKGSKDC